MLGKRAKLLHKQTDRSQDRHDDDFLWQPGSVFGLVCTVQLANYECGALLPLHFRKYFSLYLLILILVYLDLLSNDWPDCAARYLHVREG